ncbi:MAG: energy transducer TonB [Thermodesulfovibrio sp.]|uniref:energy transducer TonB n=1 Tax=Thermodesulfovibrio sp. 1176 TaxID=3043424 RepID=UPI002482B4AF|nr:energy transducer TonB [Thermodesulfovibrio sp. 1176]MDI6714046.1 energy transducer TonB [Thermodesulfovibrio sp.]
MIVASKNKLTKFLLLSLMFHFFIFLACSSFAFLTKQNQEFEVFIFNDSVSSKDFHKIEKKHKFKNTERQSKISLKNEKEISVLKSDIKETKLEQSVEINFSSDSSASSSIFLQEGSKEGKGEKIIDTEFGSTYGPKFIYREIPQYPQIARRLGKEGRVVLRLTLNERGDLLNIEVLESAPYGFTESALEAVKKSKFAPAQRDGKPIACRAILPIRFVLKN